MKHTLFILLLSLTGSFFASGRAMHEVPRSSGERATAKESAIEHSKALVTRWAQAILSKDWPTVDARTTKDWVIHGTHQEHPYGLEGVKHWQSFVDATWANTRSTTEDLIAEADKVVKRSTVYRTYRASNKQSARQVIFVYHLADGTIAEVWRVADVVTSLEQIGAQIILPGANADSGQPAPAAPENEASAQREVLALDEQAEANRRADTPSTALTADDFIGIGVGGTVFDKASAAALFTSGRVKTQSLEVTDRKVRVYGDTAVVTATRHLKDSIDGRSRDEAHRYTRVWVKRDSRWQMVSFQATKVGTP